METRLKFVLPFFLLAIVIISGCSPGDLPAVAAENIDETFLADASDAEASRAAEIIKVKPDSTAGYLQFALVYIRRARETGDHSLNNKAEAAVERALAIEPANLTARKLHTSLLASAHRFTEARESARALTNEFPDDSFAYGILVDANAELGNYDEAIKAAQEMVDLKPNSSSYARVGHLRSLHGDHAGAVEMLTTAARTADPQDKEAQSWCLVQLAKQHFKFGDIDKANKVIDESLHLSPDYPLALIEKGKILAAKGDLDDAEEILQRANSRVLHTEALILLGDIDRRHGNDDEAERLFASAEDLARSSTGDIHRFALLWADHGQRLDEALSIAETDYETNKDIYAADILAWCHYKKGRHAEAKDIIREALRLNTKDARILYHAGMIERDLGNRKQAAEYLRTALKLNPNFDLLQAENARRSLRNL
jgi:tetratricopeptide (TPR) repeat protein